MLNMFSAILDKMNNEELEKTLIQAKSLLGSQDYEKLKTIIDQKRNNSK